MNKENKQFAIKVILGILIVALSVYLLTKYVIIEYITRCGIVKEHVVTSDKLGVPTYTTIIITEDGYIESKKGLRYYVKSVGERVCWQEDRLTFK